MRGHEGKLTEYGQTFQIQACGAEVGETLVGEAGLQRAPSTGMDVLCAVHRFLPAQDAVK